MKLEDLTEELDQGVVDEAFPVSTITGVDGPLAKFLRNTVMRSTVYKKWAKSDNAKKVLTVLDRMYKGGDENPIATVSRETQLKVPTTFLTQLAKDAGRPYVSAEGRSGVYLHEEDEESDDSSTELTVVYHPIHTANKPVVEQNGISPYHDWYADRDDAGILVALDYHGLANGTLLHNFPNVNDTAPETILKIRIGKDMVDPIGDTGLAAIHQTITPDKIVGSRDI